MSQYGRSQRSLNKSTYSSSTAASSGRLVVQKEKTASKFHPCYIIALVICIGLLITGAVVTYIANMPGKSTHGFDALQVIGPLLLAVGGVGILGSAIAMALHNLRNKQVWQEKRIDLERSHVTRMSMSRSMSRPPSSVFSGESSIHEEVSVKSFPQQNNNNNGHIQNSQHHSVYNISVIPDVMLTHHLNTMTQSSGQNKKNINQINNDKVQLQSSNLNNAHNSPAGKSHSEVDYSERDVDTHVVKENFSRDASHRRSSRRANRRAARMAAASNNSLNHSNVSNATAGGNPYSSPASGKATNTRPNQATPQPSALNVSANHGQHEPPLARSSPSHAKVEAKLESYLKGSDYQKVNMAQPRYSQAPGALVNPVTSLTPNQYGVNLYASHSSLVGSGLVGIPAMGNTSCRF